jgi:hypothetical protein
MRCPRCEQDTDDHRMFCQGCGRILDRSKVGMRISTEHTRGRALDELDRKVGLYDSDTVAEHKEREFIET